jgi:hypothetical protein
LLTRRRGSFTSVDLGIGHWRFAIAAVPTTAGAGLGLVLRWPPVVNAYAFVQPGMSALPLGDNAQWVLVVAEVALAQTPADLEPVARVALENGSVDADVARTAEAMSLFRNMTRFREETLKAGIESTTALIRAYWQLSDWVMAAERQRVELSVGDATIVGTP